MLKSLTAAEEPSLGLDLKPLTVRVMSLCGLKSEKGDKQ